MGFKMVDKLYEKHLTPGRYPVQKFSQPKINEIYANRHPKRHAAKQQVDPGSTVKHGILYIAHMAVVYKIGLIT